MNIMLGTNPAGKGGIAALVRVMIEEGILKKHCIEFVVTHEQRPAIVKGLIFIRSFLIVLGKCLVARPVFIHAHTSTHGSFIRKSLLLAMARFFGCKTVIHLHGGYFDTYATEEVGSLMRWWIRHTLQNSTAVIALSESWAKFIYKFVPNSTVHVIPNTVKLPVPPSTHDQEETGRLLFLGDILPYKGVYEILSAVALLKPLFPKLKMVFGGTGELDVFQRRIEELDIAENIEILGWVETDRKAQEFLRATIFVSPAHVEGLPMAMLEAMAAKKAVVVTPVGGIPEVINDNENGLLVPVNDVEALASALRRLLEDSTLRLMLAANAYNTVTDRYCSDAVMAKFSDLYNTLESG